MNKILFLLSLLVLYSHAQIAQTPERQQNRKKKPNNFSWGATNGPTNSFSRDTTRNLKSDGNEVAIETLERKNKTGENTKLDDLKNPFDTTKKSKPVSQNNYNSVSKDYIGETEKNRTVSQKSLNSFQEVSGIGMEVKKDSAKKIISTRDASSGQLYRKNKNKPTRRN